MKRTIATLACLACAARLAAAIPGMPDEIVVQAAFSTNRGARAVRDVPARLDLSNVFGFAADVTIGDLSQFSQFNLHLKSGGGWYNFVMSPEKEGVAERLAFRVKDGKKEGEPKGLDSVCGVRVSGWRVGTNDTYIAMRNFSLLDEAGFAAIESAKDRTPRACPMPENGEVRAFWCHSSRGLGKGYDWDSSVAFLRKHGYNTLLVNLAWPGVAYYRSSVLPEYARIDAEGDRLVQCLAACRKYGVSCHVWKVCYNAGHMEDMTEFNRRMAAEGRAQVRDDGKDGWLCPSDPRNISYEIDAMAELAHKGVDGIHFDFIRYPTDKGCYCAKCRERFERATGRKVAQWPADVRKGGVMIDEWHSWRVTNITAVVRGVAERVRRESPQTKISAAVFQNPETTPAMLGQDWLDWCRKGYLDFVCPMNYVDSAALQRAATTLQLRAVSGLPVKVYPGIGLSVFRKDGCDARRLSEQIAVVRACGAPGFTVFNFDGRAEAALPLIPRQ